MVADWFEPASIPVDAAWLQEAQMSQTVASTLVEVLEEIGVRQIFGLIGDSMNPLADAVRHSKIEWIGVRHEEGAALAATGQAKLTGGLGVCRRLGCYANDDGHTDFCGADNYQSRSHLDVRFPSTD